MRASAVLVMVAGLTAGLSVAGCDAGALDRSAPVTRVIRLRPPPGTPVLRVGGYQRARPIASGFVGLSVEFQALPAYVGRNPHALDPVFEQLIRDLAPGQRPVLRIGGDSTDHAWVAVPGMSRPAGITYTVGPRWLQTAGALARALRARMIVGINLEANRPRLAGVEGRAMLAAIGPASLEALELGNEPELYGTFPWYDVGGRGVKGRPGSWGISGYVQDVSRIVRALPGVALAGPATGAPAWIQALGPIASGLPSIALATVHRYPLHRCFIAPDSSQSPSIAHLLSQASSAGLANSVAGFAAAGHAHGLTVRVDEFNTVSCSGQAGVSDTFASALWALDGAFQMARVGVDGINVHTFPGAAYQPFAFSQRQGHWRAEVKPEYYGLMMFAQAAPAGSRLLKVLGAPGQSIRRWATRTPDATIHVVLINDSRRRSHYVAVRVAGTAGSALLTRLSAPSVRARGDVTLGGQSFGTQTSTGVLTGRPSRYAVAPVDGEYVVRLPAASAAMLTLTPAR